MNDQDVYGSFSNTVSRELFYMITGQVLGTGVDRVVYEHRHRDDLVLKFEVASNCFQNIAEWDFWHDNKDDRKVARWLAPCEFISPCGIILAMKKTIKPTETDYPKTVPAFLTDLKRDNFGMLDGKLVAHDYGLYLIDVPTKRKKVNWWDS
jgi:hypothetical protein